MRRLIVAFLALVSLLGMVSCSVNGTENSGAGEGDVYINGIEGATKIEATKYDMGEVTGLVTVTEEADITHIVQNLNFLKLKKLEYNEPTAIEYKLTFYNEDEEIIKEIEITLGGWVEYHGSLHSVVVGELDINYVDGLFDIPDDAQTGNAVFSSALSRAGSGYIPEIWKNALNASKLDDLTKWNMPIYKFDTLYDLEKFKSDFGGENGFNYGWNEVPSFNEVTKDYDENFFEEYTLMLVCVAANSGSFRFGFKDVTIDGNSLTVHIEQTNNPSVVTEDMASWFITVVIPDSIIANITEFNADDPTSISGD